MTYEVVSMVLGATTVWTVEASSPREARRRAEQELRQVSSTGRVQSVRPLGYKPKRDMN